MFAQTQSSGEVGRNPKLLETVALAAEATTTFPFDQQVDCWRAGEHTQVVGA